MPKTYAATYLYGMYPEYEKQLFSFIMGGEELDQLSPDFEEITFEVNRRKLSSALVNVMKSKKVVLLSAKSGRGMSKPFKVFCAKDIKNDKNQLKVFIDCTGIIVKSDGTGKYVCTNIDVFISYLISVMHTLIYYVDESRITGNSKIMSVGAEAFSSLLTHIVDYVCKISVMPGIRDRCVYLTSMYYLTNILGKDYSSSAVSHVARKIAGISERESDVIDIQLKPESFSNIRFFIQCLSDILRLNKLTLDVILERWMFIYGQGTPFALELFPAFASMLTDTYVGAYVNNQKTIEKVVGQAMPEFTKKILEIGAESV